MEDTKQKEKVARAQVRVDEACSVMGRYTLLSADSRATLVDNRCGTTFTYELKQFVSGLKKNPDKRFFSASRGNVVSTVDGTEPILVEARRRLTEYGIQGFSVESYTKDTDEAVIKDEATGEVRIRSFQSWLSARKRSSTSPTFMSAVQRAEEVFNAHAPGKFTVTSAEKVDDYIQVEATNSTGVTFQHKLPYISKCLRNDPDYDFGKTKQEIEECKVATNLSRYGVEHPMQNSECKEKSVQTSTELYGVDHYSKTAEFHDRFRATNLARFGTEHPLQNEAIKLKSVEFSRSKYGVYHTAHPDVVLKRETTNIERYGAPHPSQNAEIRQRMTEGSRVTKIALGITSTYEGKTVLDIAREVGASKRYVQSLISEYGYEKAKTILDCYVPGGSSLTSFTVDLLKEYNPIVDKKLPGMSIRPDLRFEDQKVIVEADGLYWHSDARVTENRDMGPKFHQKRLRAYEAAGYRALFFRSHEILNKTNIVKSIVMNALGANTTRVFARKCSIEEIDSSFFAQTHLMGAGSGRCYGLMLEGKVVAGTQVKWARKEQRLLDISRFSTAPGTTVVGGWSKLIAHILKTEKPSSVQTFIDRRYGTGKHLAEQGWVKATENPSFCWTDGIQSLHRMTYPGSSGYEQGFFKIWDCGQAKYLLSDV